MRVILFCSLISLLIFSCKKNSETLDDSEQQPVILHGIAETEDTATTIPRIVYTDAGYVSSGFFTAGKVSVAWEVGEIIEFCFNQTGKTPTKTTATVLTVNGNKCTFDVIVPAAINAAQNYDVYAVIGSFKGNAAQGTYINATTPQFVNFKFDITGPKNNLSSSFPLIRNSIIQVASKSVTGGATIIAFGFKQIGSLMGIAIKNVSASWVAIVRDLKLQTTTTNQWIYDLSNANTKYDLFAGQMASTSVKTNILQVIGPSASTYSINYGNVVGTFYQYFVPVSGVLPSGLTLSLYDTGPSKTATKSIPDPTSITTGMRYYVNRNYDATGGTFP